MPRRKRPRNEQQRSAIADEAARMMQEHGLSDYRSAKAKAGIRLGLEDRGALPSNREVESALAERHRVFHGAEHADLIDELRAAALEMMNRIAEFDPRLTGPVLAGTATVHGTIDLHVFSDSPEAVGSALDALGLPNRAVQHRLRRRRDDSTLFPGYRFMSGGHEFCALVFPERGRGNAPLSAVDGRPMRRATPRDVAALLAAGNPPSAS